MIIIKLYTFIFLVQPPYLKKFSLPDANGQFLISQCVAMPEASLEISLRVCEATLLVRGPLILLWLRNVQVSHQCLQRCCGNSPE